MSHLINENRARPIRRGAPVALTVAAALAALLLNPVPAQAREVDGEVRIAVTGIALSDARSLARLRRQIAAAAHAVCPSGGLAATYREGSRRCRARAVAAAERQLQARLAARLAARGSR